MKIAIIGTRGIPNNYGGFEQLAQYLSLGLREQGHSVFVYNSSKHSYQEKSWKGINIIHRFDPENEIGTVGQFIYDLNCILHTRREHFDVILNLGYTSSSVWMRFFPVRSKVITNMDGLEWKRSKYSRPVRQFLMYAERLAVKRSDLLVADSLGIQTYLRTRYGADSTFIAYGADIFSAPDLSVLGDFGLNAGQYNMLIARMEPENNIEMILDGVVRSGSRAPFVVVGNTKNKFGNYLVNKFRNESRIRFTGPIYDERIINNLRHYAQLYFHGHSVGGTNPSLLEAMGCGCLIAAHDNQFNRGVLGQDGLFFQSSEGVAHLIDHELPMSERDTFSRNNYEKVRTLYNWKRIVTQYEELMAGQ